MYDVFISILCNFHPWFFLFHLASTIHSRKSNSFEQQLNFINQIKMCKNFHCADLQYANPFSYWHLCLIFFFLFSLCRMQKRYGPSTNTSRILVVHQVVASCHKCNEKTLVPVVHSSSAAWIFHHDTDTRTGGTFSQFFFS